MGPLSKTAAWSPARFAATPAASPQGPAPITARSSITASRDFDDLVAAGPDAHIANRGAREILQPIEVGACRRREIGQPAHAAQRLPPPGQRLVHRLNASQPVHLSRHAVERVAVETVAYTHRDLG